MFVVIGSCSCLLLPLWCVPWTLAMFSNTATTMVGSPCLTMAHLPTKGTAGLGRADVCCDLLLPLWCVPWTLAMFTNTATTMIGSPCLTMAHLPIFANTLQE